MAANADRTSTLRVHLHGRNLPGRMFRNAGVPIHGVHVGVQVRDEPVDLVPGDADAAEWQLDIRVVDGPHGRDFRGPAVHGPRGSRFLYLTWGDVASDGRFTMFRRAKLMLDAIEPSLIGNALETSQPLHGTIDLTDGFGGPRCARVGPPALVWNLDPARPVDEAG